MKRKHMAMLGILVAVLAAGLSVGEIASRQGVGPGMATVSFFSNNANGYACFLNYSYPLTGGPICLSDDPSLDLPDNATIPLGSYGIVFFPFGTASNKSLWVGTNNIEVTGSAPYDVSSSYANFTVKGDGALAVFVLPENGQPVPELSATGAMALVVLAISLSILRRRRHWPLTLNVDEQSKSDDRPRGQPSHHQRCRCRNHVDSDQHRKRG